MAVAEGQAAELTTVALDAAAAPARRHLPLLGSSDPDVTLRRMLVAGDAVAVMLALGTALTLGGRAGAALRLLWGLLAALPLMAVLFKLYGLYDRDTKRISYSTVDDLPRIFHATVIGGLLLWLYARVTPVHRLGFREILPFGLLTVLLTTSVRAAVRSLQARLVGWEPTLLIGAGGLAGALTHKLATNPAFRANVIGVVGEGDLVAQSTRVPVLGSMDQLERIVTEHGVRRLIVSSYLDDEQLLELLCRCRELRLKFSLLPKLSDMLGHVVEVEDIEGVTVFGVNPPWLPRSSRAVKRGLDLLMAATLILVFAPLMALIAIAIRLDSPGSPIFAQMRVGRNGRLFRLYKFRTMAIGAEQRQAELLLQSSDPNWVKLDRDPRITRVGHLLRRVSADELPQLWNVFRGEMSLVGPRPLIRSEDERVTGWARGRLDLTPGLTGYWQVLGRTRIPFEEMVKLDYLYVMNWSLWGDIRLVLRTLPVILSGRGAN